MSTVVDHSASSGNASSVSVPSLTGLAAGDLRLMWLTLTSGPVIDGGSLHANLGVIFDVDFGSTSERRHCILARTVQPGDPTSYTIPLTGGSNHGFAQVALRPADGCALVLDAGPLANTSDSGGTSTAPSLDPSVVDTRLMVFFAKALNSSGIVHSTPSGMTELRDQAGTGSAGNAVALNTEALASDAAAGTRSSTTTSGRWVASSLIVRDEPLIPVGLRAAQFFPFL